MPNWLPLSFVTPFDADETVAVHPEQPSGGTATFFDGEFDWDCERGCPWVDAA
jgi:hypothetical protein